MSVDNVMKVIAFSIIAWSIILWIDCFSFLRYLEKKYPKLQNWVKGGPFYQKMYLYFFPILNFDRDFDLMFERPEEFYEEYEKADFLGEYQNLLNDKRYVFRKRLLAVYWITVGLILIYGVYHGIIGQ